MAASTVAAAFGTFARKITPTDSQKTMLRQRRETADEVLREAFTGSNLPLLRTKLIGSAGRNTIIRPLNDVDVLAVFDESAVWDAYQSDSTKLLYRVRDALNKKYNVQVGARGQAIRLFFKAGPNVEIVPAFEVDGGGYVIARGKGSWFWQSSWQKTDPHLHETFMARRNQELGGRLKPLIRLLKRWNAVHSKRFTSFHLELVVQQSFNTMGAVPRNSVHHFFEWAPQNIHVHDPAGNSGDLAGSFTWMQMDNLKSALKSGSEQSGRALEAEANGDHKRAIGYWRAIFGPEFPAFG